MAYIPGNSGNNTLSGTSAADQIYGFGGADVLLGRGGNDYLNGGSSNDDLYGGAGFNDLYGGSGFDWFIMSARATVGFSDDLILDFTFDVDQIDVSAWGVSDFSQIKVLLGADALGDATFDAFYAGLSHVITVENVAPGQLVAVDFVYSAAGPKTQTGTSAGDTLFGSRYNDVLSSGYGQDNLLGGFGDDILIGGFDSDFFDGGPGYDEVRLTHTNESVTVNLTTATATYAGRQVEGLRSIEDMRTGGGSDVLIGNGFANFLHGGNGNDQLNGRFGNDYLIGGNGSNSFVFNTALSPSNVDAIGDFYAPQDFMWLFNGAFTGLANAANGFLPSYRYAEGAFSTARDSLDRIIYNTSNGGLYFDRDGFGGVGSQQFANLGTAQAPTLSHFDFVVY